MVDQFGWHPDYPGQQPWMDPQFTRLYGVHPGQQDSPQQQAQQPAPQQTMTRPTIHAEIIQVSNGESGEQEVNRYPLGVGQSQMFITQDEAVIYVKEGTQSGSILDVYPRRPPAPTPPPFNPAEYVRLDALPALVAEQVQAAMAAMSKPTRGKKETEAAD